MKTVIQAIPVEIIEDKGKFYYQLKTNKEGVIQSKKGFYSQTQALNAAEKAIDNYWYVGH